MILDELAAAARERVEAARRRVPDHVLVAQAEALPRGDFPFERALRQPGITAICEVKRASPSKGLIAPHFPHVDIARAYEAAGAGCLSVLTEPTRFLGRDEYLSSIRRAVSLPLLRKDFTVHPYQIDEAKALGADAVLLICRLLDDAQLRDFLSRCDALGLTALVEAHDQGEVDRAAAAGARVIGVNNRDLTTFQVDVGNALRLRERVPADRLFVAESGIRTAADVAALRDAGVDAILVGETLMRSPDKGRALQALLGVGNDQT